MKTRGRIQLYSGMSGREQAPVEYSNAASNE